jgi:hypothetical protein
MTPAGPIRVKRGHNWLGMLQPAPGSARGRAAGDSPECAAAKGAATLTGCEDASSTRLLGGIFIRDGVFSAGIFVGSRTPLLNLHSSSTGMVRSVREIRKQNDKPSVTQGSKRNFLYASRMTE